MKSSTNSGKSTAPRVPRGFTLLELLMAVAVASTVIAVGIFAVSSVTQNVRSNKLHSDVATLNNAIRIYLTNGGTIATGADGQAVLDKLKSVADANSQRRLAGVRNSMIDGRLRETLASGRGTERAVWNSTTQRFELETSGRGFSSFDLEGRPPEVESKERRTGTLNLAMKDKWVWDSSSAGPAKAAPEFAPTTAVASREAQAPAAITRLATPDVSLPGAIYDFSSYNPNLTVSLIDRNAPGVSQILYSIDNGPWKVYQGAPLSIPPVFLSTVRTYAAALNDEFYEDSDQRTENYETIYFTGASAGNFYAPLGDKDLVTNLTGRLRGPVFTWGTPAGRENKENELEFKGASFKKVAPDQEFELGTLSYYNGTTNSGTNATSVKILIDLSLSEPAVTEQLSFTFNLLSTPNKGKSDDEDADYVYIPEVSTSFSTVIKGKTFALVLRFGDHTKDGFTTIDTFHAHENKTLTGTIYGRLTEVKGKL